MSGWKRVPLALALLASFLPGIFSSGPTEADIVAAKKYLKDQTRRWQNEHYLNSLKMVRHSQSKNKSYPHEQIKGRFTVEVESPGNVARDRTIYDWCDCNTGHSTVTFWPRDDRSNSVTVSSNSLRWVKFTSAVDWLSWTCDGMKNILGHETHGSTEINMAAGQWISLQLGLESKNFPSGFICDEKSGRLRWSVWKSTDYVSSIPFTTGTEGYACFKIPALLQTIEGTFIAFAEARKPDCGDFAQTELVYKRSLDGGKTWGSLAVLVNTTQDQKMNGGMCGHKLTVGNVAPVQLSSVSKYPHRILAPHSWNNYHTYLVHSDDDGLTWSLPRKLDVDDNLAKSPDCLRNMSYFGLKVDTISYSNLGDFIDFAKDVCSDAKDPYRSKWKGKLDGSWQWTGVGPPGSLQLKNGRVVIPCYHSYIRGLDSKEGLPISQLYNNFGKAHVIMSDDDGDTWRLGDDWPLGEGADENQFVLLRNGSILANSRSLATGSPMWRLQARSDDAGETFSATHVVAIPQPFNGCQGSSVSAYNLETRVGSDTVFVGSPDPSPSSSILQKAVDMLHGCDMNFTGRDRVTIWKSTDGGTTFSEKLLIDSGLSAQTSLQWRNHRLTVLYEQADPSPVNPGNAASDTLLENMVVLLPNRFVFRDVPTSFASSASESLLV